MRLLNNFFKIESSNLAESTAEFVICFNADSEIYRAHFPGQPITPGVCIVQTAKELLDQYLDYETELSGVKNAKFLSVIVPEDGKTFTYSLKKITTEEATTKCQIVVTSGEAIYAKMSITCKRK